MPPARSVLASHAYPPYPFPPHPSRPLSLPPGDSNVPAGKVSFKARVGRAARLPVSDAYPPELGVVARYRGEGRVAQDGYTNAKWVEGELLQFSAGAPLTRGAELGFVFSMDGMRRFLVLFTRVNLDDLMEPQQ